MRHLDRRMRNPFRKPRGSFVRAARSGSGFRRARDGGDPFPRSPGLRSRMRDGQVGAYRLTACRGRGEGCDPDRGLLAQEFLFRLRQLTPACEIRVWGHGASRTAKSNSAW